MRTVKFILLVILVVIMILSILPVCVLQVVDADSPERLVLYQILVKPGDRFSIKWTHSVSKRPVIETYEITRDLKISTYEMIFDSFSANLPSYPEYNQKWEITKDYIRVYNYDRVFEELPVVIGKVIAFHKLIYKDKVVSLKDVDEPGGFVKIRVKKMPLIGYLREEVM